MLTIWAHATAIELLNGSSSKESTPGAKRYIGTTSSRIRFLALGYLSSWTPRVRTVDGPPQEDRELRRRTQDVIQRGLVLWQSRSSGSSWILWSLLSYCTLYLSSEEGRANAPVEDSISKDESLSTVGTSDVIEATVPFVSEEALVSMLFAAFLGRGRKADRAGTTVPTSRRSQVKVIQVDMAVVYNWDDARSVLFPLLRSLGCTRLLTTFGTAVTNALRERLEQAGSEEASVQPFGPRKWARHLCGGMALAFDGLLGEYTAVEVSFKSGISNGSLWAILRIGRRQRQLRYLLRCVVEMTCLWRGREEGQGQDEPVWFPLFTRPVLCLELLASTTVLTTSTPEDNAPGESGQGEGEDDDHVTSEDLSQRVRDFLTYVTVTPSLPPRTSPCPIF